MMNITPVIILHFATVDLIPDVVESALESKIRLWSNAAFWGYVLVIVGVVIESAELFTKWSKKRKLRIWIGEIFKRRRRRWVVSFSRWLKPKVLPVETLGFALLVIGLGLELFAGRMAEGYQDEKLGRLNEKAGLANERAEKLAKETEELRKSNLELESSLSPRHFFPTTESLNRLRQFAGTKFNVVPIQDPENPFSKERADLASTIFWSLMNADWVRVTNEPASHISVDGVLIETHAGPATETSLAADALAEELNVKGLNAHRFPTSKHPDVIVIRVGAKQDVREIRLQKRRMELEKELWNPSTTREQRLKLLEQWWDVGFDK